MQNILAISSLTVISDSMRLDSITNRALVKTGLKIVNGFKSMNWKRLMVEEEGLITYKALGWRLSPLMNSASRMGDPEIAYKLFMAKDDKDIREAIVKALEVNQARKNLQEELFREANDEYMLDRDSEYSAVSRVSRGLGIQGIISSKFTDLYKVNSVVFYCNDEEGVYQGSGRSDGKSDIREIVLEIERNSNGGVIRCGGHKGACGVTIKAEFYDTFKSEFERLSKIDKLVDKNFSIEDKHIYLVDAELKSLDYTIYDSIGLLSPYGKSWDVPLFSTIFFIKRAKKISRPKKNDMYILELADTTGTPIDCVYFTNGEIDIEIKEKMLVTIVYEVEYASGRGKGLTINIKAIAEY